MCWPVTAEYPATRRRSGSRARPLEMADVALNVPLKPSSCTLVGQAMFFEIRETLVRFKWQEASLDISKIYHVFGRTKDTWTFEEAKIERVSLALDLSQPKNLGAWFGYRFGVEFLRVVCIYPKVLCVEPGFWIMWMDFPREWFLFIP